MNMNTEIAAYIYTKCVELGFKICELESEVLIAEAAANVFGTEFTVVFCFSRQEVFFGSYLFRTFSEQEKNPCIVAQGQDPSTILREVNYLGSVPLLSWDSPIHYGSPEITFGVFELFPTLITAEYLALLRFKAELK